MESSPHKHDLSFLVGPDLDCICFERGQLQLLFHAPISKPKGIGIAIRSNVIHQTKNGFTEWDCNKPLAAYCSLLMLLRTSLSSVTEMPNGTLKLEFMNDEVVTILASNQKEESYRIWDGDTLIVV